MIFLFGRIHFDNSEVNSFWLKCAYGSCSAYHALLDLSLFILGEDITSLDHGDGNDAHDGPQHDASYPHLLHVFRDLLCLDKEPIFILGHVID